MSDERFFQRLRDDARHLQYTPDAVASARMAARIRAGVAAPVPTVSQLLAGWLRPATASFFALIVVASLTLAWYDTAPPNNATVDQIAANSAEISVDGAIGGE
jgi:hypothetical protein